MDHVVKERYPTFIDAIKDLDDCLTLLFLFSTFPSLKYVPREQAALCRRLTIEFLHAVIESKALRKVFISIKGYYFQAEIKGQKVTWIIPHYYPFSPQKKGDVDFKVMSIFVEFYTIMLGFVNYRLYQSMNLVYPPQFQESLEQNIDNEHDFVSERIAALNINLLKTDNTVVDDDENDIDIELLTNDGDSAKIIKMKEDLKDQKKLKNLFKGLNFYINREIPREPLVFIIRCLGGQVSWDSKLFKGASFNESNEIITHQIIDRPLIGRKYISRDYIQPQWVFDCCNQIKLLPTNKYFIGVDLPPHLSPFVDPDRDSYVPPEERALRDPSLIENNYENEEEDVADDDADAEEKEQLDEELDKAYRQEEELLDSATDDDDDFDDDDDDDEEAKNKRKLAKQKKKKMAVKSGELHKEDTKLIEHQEFQDDKLKARMVKNRHRMLYKKLVREKRDKDKEKNLLAMKRQHIDSEIRKRKEAKIAKKKAEK